MINKILKRCAVVGVITVFTLTPIAYAQTNTTESALLSLVTKLLEQIEALQAQVAALETQVKAARVDVAEVRAELKLSKALERGARGDEVRELQSFLKQYPDIYPEGLVTGYFGPATEIAVRRWQDRHDIEAIGIVGPKTLASMNAILREHTGRPTVSETNSESLIPAPTTSNNTPTTLPAIATTTATTTQSASTTSATTLNAVATSTNTSTATPSSVSTVATPTTGASTAASTGTTSTTTTTTTTATTTPPAVGTITVTSPSAGTQWNQGSTYTISWTTTGSVGDVAIEFTLADGRGDWIATVPASAGSKSWTVPLTGTYASGAVYTLHVYEQSNRDTVRSSIPNMSVAPPVPTRPAQPPISQWKFDGDGENTIAGAPAVTLVGSSTINTTGGRFGGYLYIPGNGHYAKVPHNGMYDLSDSFTVELWFRQRSNQAANQNLIYKGSPTNNYNFNIFRYLWNEYNSGAVIAGSTVASTGYWSQVSNPNQPPHGSWHHVVYTKTPTGAAYYIDGALIHSNSYSSTGTGSEYYGPVRTPAQDIVIGDTAVDTDIDNIRIYNYALTAGEVRYNMETDTVAYAPQAQFANVLTALTALLDKLTKQAR